MERETLKSRLGFILLSAGCAIGIGNVWKFPYMAGQGGGGAFVLFYLLFLVILGLPIMTMEFAVGRASRKSPVRAYQVLEKPGQKWHIHGYFTLIGCYLLMMFYTTVAGWMLHYFYMTAAGKLSGLNADEVAGKFTEMLASPGIMTFWMVFVVVLGILVCAKGLQNGLERVTKGMMIALLLIMVILAVNSLFMDGAKEGLSFFLVPDFGRMKEVGIVNTLVGAMNQAFFTLSLGIGAMSIFGSYIGKEHSLLGESVRVVVLDTFVAITAGLIIFPACFTFGVDQTAGPSLIFITLPNIFANMALGRLWGSLFFLFMAFAALSTVLAVFENIICCGMELTGCTRKKSSLVNLFLIILLSMPCVLGYNLWAWDGFAVFGGAVLDFEDFLVSNLFLPLGSLVYLLFCVSRYGWGWDNYKKEVNTGEGLKIHDWMRGYLTYGLPVIVLFIFAFGIPRGEPTHLMGKQLAQPEVRAAIASPLGEAEALAERAFLLEDTMHILICDDDAVFAARVETLVRDFFARRGLQVECTVCHSGEETLARRDLDLYQVALLDVDLDTMNGISLGKQLRQCSPEICLVYVSAYLEFAPEGYTVNAFRYILKRDLDCQLPRCLDAILHEQDHRAPKTLTIRQNRTETELTEMWLISPCAPTMAS